VALPTDQSSLDALGRTSLEATLGAMSETAASPDPSRVACFPKQPGSRQSSITKTPDGAALGKPLPVTCSVALEPNAMQGWTITLTIAWDAAADRSAGAWSAVKYVTADGRTSLGDGPGSPAAFTFPYQVDAGGSSSAG
jgi:hypothetical protein